MVTATPANTPNILSWSDVVTLANGSLKERFHGAASYVTAKLLSSRCRSLHASTAVTVLHSRTRVRWRSTTSGTTSLLRTTCRHGVGGIVDGNESAKSGNLAQAELTWDDAYWGGSCLRLKGQTTTSRVKLFKTLLKNQSLRTTSLLHTR